MTFLPRSPAVALLAGLLCWFAQTALAQTPKPAEATADPSPKLQWAYGLRLRTADLSDLSGSTRLRPALGLRYGRWRFGTVDQEDLTTAYTAQRQASLGYQLAEGRDLNATVSLRLHNMSMGEGIDSLGGGRYTLRSRLALSQRLDADWTAIGEGTLDVLGRGDGVTLQAGVARSLYRTPTWMLGSSAKLVWASASHWQNAHAVAGVPRSQLNAGLGGLEVGLGMRGNLGRQWSWNAALNSSTPIGQIRRDVTTRSVPSASFGLQRFGN
jgi:hypothetical protein